MAKKKLAHEPRSFVQVTIERTITERMNVGILVTDVEDAGDEVLALDKVHRDAGWQRAETSEPEVIKTHHTLGVFDVNSGRLEPAR